MNFDVPQTYNYKDTIAISYFQDLYQFLCVAEQGQVWINRLNSKSDSASKDRVLGSCSENSLQVGTDVSLSYIKEHL